MYLNKISYALFIPYSLVDYQKSKFLNIIVLEKIFWFFPEKSA